MLDYKALGKRIQEQRKAINKTQEELGELAGLSTVHISHIEGGSAKLSLDALISICNVLEVTPDLLLFETINAKNERLKDEVSLMLKDCSEKDTKLIIELIKAVKHAQKE
jgi:HTH-type transcriptional regulator, cell division transcriptional repressor